MVSGGVGDLSQSRKFQSQVSQSLPNSNYSNNKNNSEKQRAERVKFVEINRPACIG